MCPAQSINLHNIGLPVFVRYGSLIVHVCGEVVREIYMCMCSFVWGSSERDLYVYVFICVGK